MRIPLTSGLGASSSLMTNFSAEAEGIKPDDIVRRLIEIIPTDEEANSTRGKLPELFRSADAG